MDAKAMTKRIHPACQDFVAVVEELLIQRRQEAALASRPDSSWQDDDWAPRTWTRTELEYMVYSSYKQMRNGRITRRAVKRSWRLRITSTATSKNAIGC